MKTLKTILLIAAALICCTLQARTYSVSDIPNVHLADSTRFVSNPDGILSAEGEATADALLHNLMQQTSAEVVCVAVDDIDSDIDDFATDLFRDWGIGKKDNNNGLLLLIVNDRHEVVIRTGTGLEGILPDGLCGSIIRANITPRFREGDYDGGTIGALADIAGIISSPEAREEVMSKYRNNEEADGDVATDLFRFYLSICGVITLICLALLLVTVLSTAKVTRYEKYLKANDIYPILLFASFIGLGMPLVALVPLLLWRRKLRYGTHLCTGCGTKMQLVDEVRDNDYLTRAQDIEEKIGAVDYDVWRCPNDGETEIIPYIQRKSSYTVCPVCHARTMRVVSDRITVQPTTFRTGMRVVEKRCMNCGYDDSDYHTLPKTLPVIIPGGGGGRGSGGFGGGGGGSFGGGFTAGGGARGGW